MSTHHREVPGLLAAAHGTRNPRGQGVVRGPLEMLRAMRPGLDVRVAYLDVQAPTVTEALAEQVATTPAPPIVVPLLLSSGKHACTDIPGAAARFPGTVTAAPLGPDPELARKARERLEQEADVIGPGARVVLAAAGSSHAEGRADAERAAGLLEAQVQVPVVPTYAAAARPMAGQSGGGGTQTRGTAGRCGHVPHQPRVLRRLDPCRGRARRRGQLTSGAASSHREADPAPL